MILGVRCSNSDYSIALLKGKKSKPQIVDKKSASFPKNFDRPALLRWLIQEIEDYLKIHPGVLHIAIKGAEPMAQKGGAYGERVEGEAMFLLSAARHGMSANRKVKPTIAKDLGLAGKAKALDEDLDTSVVANFKKFSIKEKEAILVAWSELQL